MNWVSKRTNEQNKCGAESEGGRQERKKTAHTHPLEYDDVCDVNVQHINSHSQRAHTWTNTSILTHLREFSFNVWPLFEWIPFRSNHFTVLQLNSTSWFATSCTRKQLEWMETRWRKRRSEKRKWKEIAAIEWASNRPTEWSPAIQKWMSCVCVYVRVWQMFEQWPLETRQQTIDMSF